MNLPNLYKYQTQFWAPWTTDSPILNQLPLRTTTMRRFNQNIIVQFQKRGRELGFTWTGFPCEGLWREYRRSAQHRGRKGRWEDYFDREEELRWSPPTRNGCRSRTGTGDSPVYPSCWFSWPIDRPWKQIERILWELLGSCVAKLTETPLIFSEGFWSPAMRNVKVQTQSSFDTL